MTKKITAITFLEMASRGSIQEAYDQFVAHGFIHHNQYFRGDRQSLLNAMKENAKKNPNKILEVKKAIEEGDTVVTLSHIKQNPDDPGAAVVHIFRFENERIVELWDLGQAISKESQNENGMF